MSISRYIALRYFSIQKPRNIIQWISWVGILGIMVGTMALVVVLAVFNGLTDLIQRSISQFDPDIKIIAKQGKYFDLNQNLEKYLKEKNILFTKVLEGKALASSRSNQHLVYVKGVDENYERTSGIKEVIYQGEYNLKGSNIILGYGVAYLLQAKLENFLSPTQLKVPKMFKGMPMNEDAATNSINAINAGIFFFNQKEFDDQYIICHLRLAQDLFMQENKISAYELKLTHRKDIFDIQKDLQRRWGDQYDILTWYDQHKTLYKVMSAEKRIAFVVIFLLTLIAASTILSALMMLVIDKQKDIGILLAMGAGPKQIQGIFLWQGFLMGLFGVTLGVIGGLLICFSQDYWHWFKLPNPESFVIDYYPVQVRLTDIVVIAFSTLCVTVLAAFYPAQKASQIMPKFLVQ
ncbi:MAG: FtsX-like permease family protein [Bacteroidia bacterium]|nr:FtsX-like permease family protein [Bacteroidia bacterium]MDW8301544.1 FtsX-like permease family protein [Bacteroidia bacterium]